MLPLYKTLGTYDHASSNKALKLASASTLRSQQRIFFLQPALRPRWREGKQWLGSLDTQESMQLLE